MRDTDPARMIAALAAYGHNGRLGMRYVDHGADWAEMALDYDARLASDAATGTIASGPIVALMDMAASTAVWLKRGAFVPQATLDLRVDYLRPAVPGRAIVGRGECYRITRHIAFVRGQAHDGDPADPVAHVAGTCMFLGPEPSA